MIRESTLFQELGYAFRVVCVF